PAVSVFAKIILCADFSEDFVAQKTRIAVTDRVVERAAHGVFEGTIPFFAIGFDEIESGSAGRLGDIPGIDEDADHHGDFLLRDEIVYDVEGGIVTVAVGVPATVVEDHNGGGRAGFVLRRNVNPVFAFHAVVDFAYVRDFLGESSGWNAGLRIGKRRERG